MSVLTITKDNFEQEVKERCSSSNGKLEGNHEHYRAQNMVLRNCHRRKNRRHLQ